MAKLYSTCKTAEDIDTLSDIDSDAVTTNLYEDCLCLIEAIKKFKDEGTTKNKLEMFELIEK